MSDQCEMGPMSKFTFEKILVSDLAQHWADLKILLAEKDQLNDFSDQIVRQIYSDGQLTIRSCYVKLNCAG